MRKNIYNTNKLTLFYREEDQKFELIRNEEEYGRKYSTKQASSLKITINQAFNDGLYNGVFRIEPEAEEKLNDYQQEKESKKKQKLESLVSSA